jgi:hypothetical protein
MVDDDECGAVGEMRIGRGNRSNPRKMSPVQLRPLQVPHDLAWARTRHSLVGSYRKRFLQQQISSREHRGAWRETASHTVTVTSCA